MKLRLPVAALADAVSYTARALPARPPVPVLAGMLLTTTDGGLHLAAFDYEVYASDTTTAEVADDGRALVPGRLLNDICARMPKTADVDLELVGNGARLAVASGTARFTLPTLPLDEYPELPALPDAVATVPADAFADAVAQVVVAAATDDTLPVLTGVQLRLDGELLVLTATDRYRIARREVAVRPTGTLPGKPANKRRKPEPGEGPDPAASAAAETLVPARALSEAARALDGEHPLTLHWTEGMVGFSIPGGRSYTTRILSGHEAPNMDAVLAGIDPTAVWTLPVADTVAAVQRVALVAARNTPVLLTLDGDRLRIEAGSGDDARASDRVPVNAHGDMGADSIAFSPGFLIDALKSLGAPEAEMRLRHPHKPVLMLPRLGDGAKAHYRHMLMPVRLSG
ncbi:DNA polymerase III subunit beta [Kitasatospora phosalacinea]|uniref:DNA polymerase III subunit beta n=1 Tax=Kitasatospora phosalacinea TaxID=2065 RepID=A0A9W6QF18_9ACTN|nr:DNA polymerase III subunit beta [Kitasatospora phosalacinea]GLW73673.1 DNA polymerase III subunit beta [Kitasatospora phosalacinea]